MQGEFEGGCAARDLRGRRERRRTKLHLKAVLRQAEPCRSCREERYNSGVRELRADRRRATAPAGTSAEQRSARRQAQGERTREELFNDHSKK